MKDKKRKMERKMERKMRRKLLFVTLLALVFVLLVIVLVSVNVMAVCDITLPQSFDLGNLSIFAQGDGASPGSGKASIFTTYDKMNVNIDTSLGYCGFPQFYEFQHIKGRGDGIPSVKSYISKMALEFSCNKINRTVLSQLLLSEGPVNLQGTMEIKENNLSYEASIRYVNKFECGIGQSGGTKICEKRVEEPISCQRQLKIPEGKPEAISRTKGALTYIHIINNTFPFLIPVLKTLHMDDVYNKELIDKYSYDCCPGAITPANCSLDSDCGSPTYGSNYCESGDVVRTETKPVCVNPGLDNSACSSIEVLNFVDYCELNEKCQNAQCASPASCSSDTDGADIYTQGFVFTDISNFTDTCLDEDYVAEYTCVNSVLGYEITKCPGNKGICEDGKCADFLPDQNKDGNVTTEETLSYVNNYYVGSVNETALNKGLEQREAKIRDK